MAIELNIFDAEVSPLMDGQTDVVLRVKFGVVKDFPDWVGPDGNPMILQQAAWAVLDTSEIGTSFTEFEQLSEATVRSWVEASSEYADALAKIEAEYARMMMPPPQHKRFLFNS